MFSCKVLKEVRSTLFSCLSSFARELRGLAVNGDTIRATFEINARNTLHKPINDCNSLLCCRNPPVVCMISGVVGSYKPTRTDIVTKIINLVQKEWAFFQFQGDACLLTKTENK